MRLRVGLVFGGRSVEHEVSVSSATSILAALDRERYDVSLIEVDRSGHWHLRDADHFATDQSGKGREVSLSPVPGAAALFSLSASVVSDSSDHAIALDVIFPIIHGRGGEDGALQGLLELKEIAYVGSGVLGSAIQMDKDIAKKLLAHAGIPVLPWLSYRQHELDGDGLNRAVSGVSDELGFPVFVKPANSGSSVGIQKACNADELFSAIREALLHDDKILVERALDAREIEVAILGDAVVEASIPGEIVPPHGFYDYEAKYLDGSTELLIPAPVPEQTSHSLRAMAIKAFRAVEGAGMARVDFLVDRATGEAFVNELNSLPGFTDASMYARLWEASGLPYPKLLDRLIDLALERRSNRNQFRREIHHDGSSPGDRPASSGDNG
jgi:D-alanine-D-alanine ligase